MCQREFDLIVEEAVKAGRQLQSLLFSSLWAKCPLPFRNSKYVNTHKKRDLTLMISEEKSVYQENEVYR